MTEFMEFPKIARLSRGTVVTEKIDGTNAQVFIEEIPLAAEIDLTAPMICAWRNEASAFRMWAGSRSRYVTPADDNFGFARWVAERADELRALGPGRHYGEWWGSGIQRGYGLAKGEKRFSLFNVGRWRETPPPACCSLVPVLHEGDFDMVAIESSLAMLREFGSRAAPGFMKPEGVVVYHAASRTYFKKTIERDGEPKGLVR